MASEPMHQQDQIESIIEQHKGIFIKVARVYCADEDDIQDLLQEISIQVWKSLPRYNPSYKMSTWLYRIALNVAITHLRKQRHRDKFHVPLDLATADAIEVQAETKEFQLLQLEQFISELKIIDKALMLLYLEEKTHQEMAEIMGISVSNVGTKIGRIKELLRKKFKIS